MEAEEILRKVYGNARNFMTPQVLEREKIRESIAYELSMGTDFNGEAIYGVSVVKYLDGKAKKLLDQSRMFYSLQEAKEHIEKLKNENV